MSMRINLEQYQQLNLIPTGITNSQYTKEVVKVFKIDGNKYTQEEVKNKIDSIKIPEIKDLKKFKLTIDGQKFGIVKDIMKSTFNEWIQYESIVGASPSQDDIIRNLHKILAIYVRPYKRKWFFFKRLKRLDEIDIDKNQQLMKKIDIEDALVINLFFYQNETSFMEGIVKHSLNTLRLQQKPLTPNKSKASTKTSDGI